MQGQAQTPANVGRITRAGLLVFGRIEVVCPPRRLPAGMTSFSASAEACV